MSIRTVIRRSLRKLTYALEDLQRAGPVPDAGDMTSLLPPVFVGGTGRSGTTVLGRLLDVHPRLYTIPWEVKFVSEPGGLTDLVEGRTTIEAFVDRLMGNWYLRKGDRGLHRLVDKRTIDDQVRLLRAGLRTDPWRAAAAFTHHLIDQLAIEAGAATWVDTTPSNVHRGPALVRMFPGMRLVHSVRDGRDVACSVVARSWGPDDPDAALDWWASRLDRAFEVTASMSPEHLRVVQLEDLVIHGRDREYAALLEFLGLDDDPAMHAYFEDEMAPGRAHAGRWQRNVPAARIEAFVAHYEQLANRIVERGWPYHPGAQSADPSPAA